MIRIQVNRGPPLNGLSREQKLAHAAYHLEQHEQNMKLGICNRHQHEYLITDHRIFRDKIREMALCAQEYENQRTGSNNLPQHIRQEPRPDDFRAAMRIGWKSHKPKPVVRISRRSQPVFGGPSSNGHVAIAKRGVYSQ